MRINTKVVWDIESGQILSRESYSYNGPLELCTNVTAAVPVSNPGAYWVEVRTVATPGVGAVDQQAGGHGGWVLPNGAVAIFSMPLGGQMGMSTLSDGSLVMSIFAPASWEDGWQSIQQTPPQFFTQILTGTLSFSGTLTDRVMFTKALTGVLSFAGTLNRKTSHLLAGILSFTGNMTRKTRTSKGGSLSFSGNLDVVLRVLVEGVLSFVGTLTTIFIPGPPPGGGTFQRLRTWFKQMFR